MNVGNVLATALDALVDSRVYADRFPQEIEEQTLPAIRFTVISADPAPDLCGTDDTTTDDVRVLLDAVARTKAGAQTLYEDMVDALMDLDPPCVREGASFTFDPSTRSHRASLTVVFYPSSA